MWSSGILWQFCLSASLFSCFLLSLELINGFLQKCSSFSLSALFFSDYVFHLFQRQHCPLGYVKSFLIYSVLAISTAHSSNLEPWANFSFWHRVLLSLLHLLVFWSWLEHMFCPPPVSIYRQWALTLKAPFWPDQTPSWAAQSLQVTRQTISSSAGGVRSANRLLRHRAVKLPLLHFLNLFLILHPPSFSHHLLIIFLTQCCQSIFGTICLI